MPTKLSTTSISQNYPHQSSRKHHEKLSRDNYDHTSRNAPKIIHTKSPSAPRETCELGLNEPKGEKTLDGKASKAPPVLEKVKRVSPGLTANGKRFLFNSDLFLFNSDLARIMLCPNANPDAGDFSFFWYFPPPKKGGGGAQQQQ